jgi:DsbC/DsbD-like thiol-disulfide interchange protein
MQLLRIRCLVVVLLSCAIGSSAQAPEQPVRWKASANPSASIKPGSNVNLDLSAEVQEGWHVYALTQSAGGPTPLQISLDPNDVAEIIGEPSGTAPVKKHDPSFDLDTEFYSQSFVLQVPLQIRRAVTGNRQVSLRVRFQACNGQICLPPKVVHLSVPIKITVGA